MIKKFQYAFNELGITKTDIEELMGFEDGVVPDPFPELIEQALNFAPSVCNIRGGYKVYHSIEQNKEKQTIKIAGIEFNPTNIVISQFKNASAISIFTCSAGHEISDYSKHLSAHGDPLLGYVFDVIGSITVEKAMNKIQKSLEEECRLQGLNISDRFSPGYCDWSVSEQQMLFALLPENFCGITLSESSLMSPIKSVSGMIGIGSGLRPKGNQCYWCKEKNCIYGKIKRKKKIKKKQ